MKSSALVFLLSTFFAAGAASAQPLYLPAEALSLDFDIRAAGLDAASTKKVADSAAFFALIQEKADRFWRSQDGRYFCIQPDGPAPVPQHFMTEAKAYGYSVKPDDAHHCAEPQR